ncbi:MAG: hypothetical protein RMZ41_002655 [Nostoc sp. DedVER02]|uniref:hypothetical protein n=1 Tax=unclassified Nostoc TaxID=2593658 RepID=UPI002AD451CB|nr:MULTISPECIES: hypothetical protein [unclassified Nostoc]MDZ7986943.1 hypothetical protein [Nostoc sp. DedVER02]MDZ8116461.1 hypothetical protein [Nostoc sp. DedVER01b]
MSLNSRTVDKARLFEVEFSNAWVGLYLRHGRTYESVGLRPEQIMVLHFEPASPDSGPEMVTA